MAEPIPDMAAYKQQNILNTVRSYGRQLFAFIRSRVNTQEDAEDVLQDVWAQLSDQPEIEAIESISGWLHRVARNRIIDRSRKKQESHLEDFGHNDDAGNWVLPDFMLSDIETPENSYLRQMFWEVLFAALEELPTDQRTVFERNELGDMTLQQIADADNVSIKTVISRKRYAVLHLRKRLEELYNDLITD